MQICGTQVSTPIYLIATLVILTICSNSKDVSAGGKGKGKQLNLTTTIPCDYELKKEEISCLL